MMADKRNNKKAASKGKAAPKKAAPGKRAAAKKKAVVKSSQVRMAKFVVTDIYRLHPMRKYFELIYAAIVLGQNLPKMIDKEKGGRLRVDNFEVPLKAQNKVRAMIYDDIKGEYPPDMQVLMVDYLKNAPLPMMIDLKYPFMSQEVLSITNQEELRAFVEAWMFVNTLPESAIQVAGKYFKTFMTLSSQGIVQYRYFFWNLSLTSEYWDIKSGYPAKELARYIRDLRENVINDGFEDPITGNRIEWSRISHGGFKRDSEGEVLLRMPCESYDPSLAIMSGEIKHTDLFIMLGLQRLNPETVQERAQELLTMSMDFARTAGRAGIQGNMWKNILAAHKMGDLMQKLNIPLNERSETLDDTVVVKDQTQEEAGLVPSAREAAEKDEGRKPHAEA